MNVLNKWALFLYDPILKNEVRKIQDSDSGIYGAKIASEVHKELKKYGGVKPPREFVFMDRAAVGLGSIFMIRTNCGSILRCACLVRTKLESFCDESG